jgi:hypothetical protein
MIRNGSMNLEELDQISLMCRGTERANMAGKRARGSLAIQEAPV